MAENKVSEAQLAVMRELQQNYEKLLSQYGELHLKKRIIEADIAATEDSFNELEAQRQEVSRLVKEQFGQVGTVNLETGEFKAQ